MKEGDVSVRLNLCSPFIEQLDFTYFPYDEKEKSLSNFPSVGRFPLFYGIMAIKFLFFYFL